MFNLALILEIEHRLQSENKKIGKYTLQHSASAMMFTQSSFFFQKGFVSFNTFERIVNNVLTEMKVKGRTTCTNINGTYIVTI